ILGAIVGLPLSYYFHPQAIRFAMSIIDYVKNFDEVYKSVENFIGNVILSVVVFAVLGGIIGYFMDKNAKR
ncbi:MAG: hypothetical protein Q7J86_08175, partial [Bacteroidota bacterium]|nr:hypothetical protein [Bacteroidota bacterium]